MKIEAKEPKITMTIDVYSDGSTKIIAAESEIRDTDMAQEMV